MQIPPNTFDISIHPHITTLKLPDQYQHDSVWQTYTKFYTHFDSGLVQFILRATLLQDINGLLHTGSDK